MNRMFPALFLALIGLAVPLRAQTVSVALLEDSKGAEARDLSDAVLSGCLDHLFAEGFIATNETIGRIDRTGFQSGALGMNSAREGYVDYVALVWIRYVETPSDPPIRVPEYLTWRLVRVRDGSPLAAGDAAPPRSESATDEERLERLSRFGRALADAWTKALRKERG